MDVESSTNASNQPEHPVPRHIESASASTRDQANGSSFAYTLAATVLAILALIGISLGLLLYSVAIQTTRAAGTTHDITSFMMMNDEAPAKAGADGTQIFIL